MLKSIKKYNFKKSFKLFCKLLKTSPLLVTITIILTTIIGFIPYIEVRILGTVGNTIMSGEIVTLMKWLLLLISCKLFIVLINYFTSILKDKILLDISLAFEKELICKTLKIELREKEKELYNNVSSRAFGAINPNQLISIVTSFPNLISSIITCISLTVLLCSINYFIPITIYALFFLTINIRLKSVSKFYTSLREQTKELRLTNTHAGYLLNINSLSELKSYKATEWMLRKWRSSYDIWAKKYIKTIFKNSRNMQLINVIMDRLILPLISLLFLFSKTTGIYNIIVCIQSAEQLASNLNLIVNDIAFFSTSEEISQDYYSLINFKENTLKREQIDCPPIGIECENISYSYDEKKYALSNISFNIKPGEKIALVGLNGSGKTTLSKLLLNLYNTQNGKINYYTNDKTLTDTEISQMSALFQNYCVYYDFTILENVLLGNTKSEDISKATLILNDFDLNITDKVIGNAFGGIELSGGQSQKLALGRCLYKDNHGLVCLDEPLATLDPIFEPKLIKQFISSINNSTCIFVTHRLSSAILADRIIMLEDGRIIEKGTHNELMMKKGKYYEYFNSQAEMYR